MEANLYSISIKGNGTNFEYRVSEQVAKDLIVRALSQNTIEFKPSPQETHTHNNAPKIHSHGDTQMSIREFLTQHNAKRMPDKITSIAYFLKFHEEKASFSNLEIMDQFELAGEKRPSNLARDVRWALACGWIAKKSGPEELYYITNSGMAAVNENFSQDVIKRTSALNPSKPKSKKKPLTNQD